MLDSQGQVVGVISSTDNYTLNAVKINHLKEFIKGNVGLNCSRLISTTSCIKKEIKNLKKSADLDKNTLAQYQLAMMYYDGEGKEQNFELAFQMV